MRWLSGEFLRVPVQKGRRLGAQVHRHVPHPAMQTAHQFHLGVRRALKVQAANGTHGGGAGVVDLHDVPIAEDAGQFARAEQAAEAAARVGVGIAGDDHHAGKIGAGELHAQTRRGRVALIVAT